MPFQLLTDYDTMQRRQKLFTKELPRYVTNNLSPRFPVRDYQLQAVNRFRYYLTEDEERKNPTHLLFQMATGSGKTLLMAACMLELYKLGYRRFIFFVNSTAIIEKTRDNFLNAGSQKYLFAPQIHIDDRQVPIREVSNFATADEGCINIHFTTIQGLHSRLNQPKENSLTYEDFEDQKIVLLSDEAHHMNVDTRAAANGQLSIEELKEYTSWESTAMRIFRADNRNVLLEFTATADLHEEAIARKYDDKLIYDYSLKRFYQDKWSKEVAVLQASLPAIDRALQAIILSQYRHLVAAHYGIPLKPVVMFKANMVSIPRQPNPAKVVSSQFREQFDTMLRNLSPADIGRIRATSPAGSLMDKVFTWLAGNGTTDENLILLLQDAFAADRCISVDSLSEKQQTQLVINSLESPANSFRAVFAVEALNEGWDVLNLFDIVRLYDTRDARNGRPGKVTMSEAQLIGRGARYYPFVAPQEAGDAAEVTSTVERPKFQRKYDDDVNHPLRICEELHYHSANNSQYINELNTALDAIGIKPSNVVVRQHKLKDSFKETAFFKSGIIFTNEAVAYANDDVTAMPDYIREKVFRFSIETGFTQENTLLQDSSLVQEGEYTETFTKPISWLGESILRTATQRIPFYTFDRLKKIYPNLQTLSDLYLKEDYLGANKVELRGNQKQLERLSPEKKLQFALSILESIIPDIERGSVDRKGSKTFTGKSINRVFTDKEMNFVLSEDGDAETGYPMKQPKNPDNYLDLSGEDWYAFEENYGTSEEKKLVKFIKAAMEKLKKNWKEVYLLRNERYFQLYRFSDGRAIEPDFVLMLQKGKGEERLIYQLFIEPKGSGFLKKDEWKEDFLKEIEHKAVIHQSKAYRLIGMPFFNATERMDEFGKRFDETALQ